MSTHAWLTTTFRPDAVYLGRAALLLAVERGAEFSLACRFVGYVIETSRQASNGGAMKRGAHDYLMRREGSPAEKYPRESLERFWESRAVRKHKYASGRNGLNYEAVGRRMFLYNADVAGLDPKTNPPPESVYDRLLEIIGLAPG